MRRSLVALLGAPVGYIVLASAGYWAIELFSNNAFDHSLEASMTAPFVIGPGGANRRIYRGIGSGRHEAGNSHVTVDLGLPVELTGKCACILPFAGDHKHTDGE